MKQLLALVAASMFLLAATAFANTYTNWVSTPAGATEGSLEVKPVDPGTTITIPKDAQVVIVDEDGKPVDPQPGLTISPTKGGTVTSYKISRTDGQAIGEGNKVRISEVETTDVVPPVGTWSS